MQGIGILGVCDHFVHNYNHYVEDMTKKPYETVPWKSKNVGPKVLSSVAFLKDAKYDENGFWNDK